MHHSNPTLKSPNREVKLVEGIRPQFSHWISDLLRCGRIWTGPLCLGNAFFLKSFCHLFPPVWNLCCRVKHTLVLNNEPWNASLGALSNQTTQNPVCFLLCIKRFNNYLLLFLGAPFWLQSGAFVSYRLDKWRRKDVFFVGFFSGTILISVLVHHGSIKSPSHFIWSIS